MTLSHLQNAVRKSFVCITFWFAPANDYVLFVLVKLAFVALLSGVDGSGPILIFGLVNFPSLSLSLDLNLLR